MIYTPASLVMDVWELECAAVATAQQRAAYARTWDEYCRSLDFHLGRWLTVFR